MVNEIKTIEQRKESLLKRGSEKDLSLMKRWLMN